MFFSAFQHIWNNFSSAMNVSKFWLLGKKILNFFAYHQATVCLPPVVEPSWNVMSHVEAGEGKWRGNWRMEWVASSVHTASEHGVSSITTADAHNSTASSRLNWLPCRFKWTRPFRRKRKSGFCACAITFQTQSTLTTFWRALT